MRLTFLDLLACPRCAGALACAEGSAGEDGHVLTGSLLCGGCAVRYPIVRGVPRLLPDAALRSDERENTAARFGYEWNRFSDFDLEEEEKSMATWFVPRQLDDLRGRTVLDVGCGMGRHAVIAAGRGVSRLVGLDLGDAVEAAFANTRQLASVCIVQGDITHPPLRTAVFDAAYSLGVLHHMPDPRAGFAAIAPAVRPGGWFQVWLYGSEGNGWILRFVDRVRRWTARLPLPLLRLLAWALTVPIWLLVKTVYRPPGIGPRLPYGGYLHWLGRFGFRKIHAIVFDHALAPVAHYLNRSQAEALVGIEGWRMTGIHHSRGMSWGVAAERVAEVVA